MSFRNGAELEHTGKGSPPAYHYLFREQVRKSPDETALVDRAGHLTYRELDLRSDLLAQRLVAGGVERGSVVGIYMERCSEFVVAMIASMKAGAAFLPMELAYPASMLEGVTDDASPAIVVTKSGHERNVSSGVPTFLMDPGWHEDIPEDGVSLPEVTPEDLIFIAYSSGTTGRPKGIANPHRAAVGSYLWRFGVDAPSPGDRVGCNVFFIWEVLRPLLLGATSVIIPDEEIYDPRALISFLGDFDISEVLFTPSLLETVLNNTEDSLELSLPSLRTLWLNGEVVTRALVERAAKALPKTRLLTVYSISEAHEVAAGDLLELSENPHSTYCPVGTPMSDAVHVLDEEMHAVPDGEPGELYVGGDWLAAGYVNLPEKTAERFIEHHSGQKLYRTGDRARKLPGGDLEVLGRCDFMVKVRGYSIELGAVENAIESSLPVRSCCVVADGDEGTDKRLVAYLVPQEEGSLPNITSGGRSPDSRDVLRDSLPHYAIPAVYVALDALPLQETTGKVDRSRLPEPPKGDGAGVPEVRDIRLPDGASERDIESAMCRVFEAVLRLDEGDVSPQDDFFEIGGHSLAAAEATGSIEDISGRALSVGDFLGASSPGSLAGLLVAGREASGTTPGSPGPDDSTVRAMEEDAVLDADILPEDPLPVTVADARRIFVTGGTGFLGAFVISTILERSDAEVFCLVRDRGDGSSNKSKLRENLRYYGLWKSWMEERLSGISGELGSRRLGLPEEDFGRLADGTDLVIHAGASVNLIYPYRALAEANVEGTREVLRLCCTGRAKPLIHISTNGVFPQDYGTCTEDAPLDSLRDGLSDGYGQSKWVAEKLVSEARDRGLPACVFRPGNISGHGETGMSNPRDFLTALFEACLNMGSAPDIDGWRVEMSPVDFVTEAIIEIASDPDSYGRTFHLANPSPAPASKVLDLLEDPDGPLERIDLGLWLDDLSRLEGSERAKTALSGEPSHLFETDSSRFDDRNTRRALADTGISRPDLDSRLLNTYRTALQGSRDLVRDHR